jgi:hypothetical protein
MKRLMFMCCLAAFGFATPVSLFAQHAGDLEFRYAGGKISLEADSGEPGFLDGHRLFGADMNVGGLFDRNTDEPGFISEIDIGLGIGANDVIDYNVLESRFGYYLNYWNVATGMVENTSTTLRIDDNPTGFLVVSSMFGGTGTGAIGQADGLGDFHSHIDFTLSEGADLGIYAMLMEMTTDAAGVANSDPFWVVFNYGMSETDHENAMAFFGGSAIPEPSSAMLLGILGLGLTTVRSRRRD